MDCDDRPDVPLVVPTQPEGTCQKKLFLSDMEFWCEKSEGHEGPHAQTFTVYREPQPDLKVTTTWADDES